MGELLNRAILFAVRAHDGQLRKGGNIPYILHPLEAAAIAATLTEDEEVLAAAVLHDVVEDTGTPLAALREAFGERVAALVAAESEDKREGLPAGETWRVRKEETVRRLETACREEKILVLADKLSNLRSLYQGEMAAGDVLWQRFHQKDKGQHRWYYESIGARLGELAGTAAYQEYQELLARVFGT